VNQKKSATRIPLRVGFIGAGANTRAMHLPGFQKIEGISLSVVANRSMESSQRVAKDFSIARVAADWRAVVNDPEVDAVCIGTWPNMHAEITLAALAAGKHVLCEARMARNLGEAREMLAASKAYPNQVCQIVPAPFSLDFDRCIRQQIEKGALGRLLEVRVTHTGAQYASAKAPLSWRQDRELSGNNVLTMGIMHETILRWIDSDPDWLIADGMVAHATRPAADGKTSVAVDIPDSLSVFGRFARDRMRFIYHFSGLESGRPRMEFRVNGSMGALRFDAAQKQLWYAKAGETEEKRLTIPRSESRGWQVEAEFVQSIREGKPVERTSFAEGHRYMHFTEMVARSLSGNAARIEWDQL
jgi:predicted dehydrogenase